MPTAAEKQRAYRDRQREKAAEAGAVAERVERMSAALRQIVTILEGRPGPVAIAIRAAAEEGLKA